MNDELLEKNLKSINDRKLKVFSEIDNEIKSLLKIQFLMEYHVVRNTLISAFSKNTHKDIHISFWRYQHLDGNKCIEAKTFINKPEDLITSFDKEALIDTRGITDSIFSALHFDDIKWMGDIRKDTTNKFHNFPMHIDSLPLIDKLVLNEELNKTYQKTLLTINLPDHEYLSTTKKMKI